jgi:hypothetical protein
MSDDAITNAATKSRLRRAALTTTTMLIRRRFDPRLIAADLARVAVTRSIARIAAVKTTPRQRKRAIIGASVAAAAAIGLRVLYRSKNEKHSPEAQDDARPTA